MTDLKKLLGNRIKTIRKARNLTQEQLAEFVNIGTPNISYIENGKFAPSIETLQKISWALCVEPYELYLFEEISPIGEIRKKLISIIDESDIVAIELYNYYLSQKLKTLR